ncbi:putative DNA repair protein RadC [Peptostreptococcaceae bacterium oral taxon 113 str. W5053]|nr:putative DNA repair protein RadC [Peptostreptococcaceae bacterium oral taxon 113 str. W5053]
MKDKSHGIKNMEIEEQPREKLIRYGASSLSDSELLAILVRFGTEKADVLTLSAQMLEKSGGLHYLADYSYEELCEFDGIKSGKATILLAAMEMANRVHFRRRKKNISITNPDVIFNTYGYIFTDKPQEEFWVLLLDTKNNVFYEEQISVGTLNASLVHPRDVFRLAVKRSAKSIVLMHNHPSGDPEPSREDLLLTKRLLEAGDLLGIPVLDHIVFGRKRYFSFKKENLIK